MSYDFPDPDEEFDLVHEDEYEVLREIEATQSRKTDSKSIPQPQQKKGSNEDFDAIHEDEYEVLREIEAAESQKTVPNNVSNKSQEKESNSWSNHNGSIPSQSTTNCNKRSIDLISHEVSTDTFGFDFNDIDQYESAKKRLRWDKPDEIIKAIIERRQNIHTDGLNNNLENSETVKKDKSDCISRRVPSWNFVAVTRSDDGERFYVKVSNKNNYVSKNYRPSSNSLLKSFNQLKNEAEQILLASAEKANRLQLEPTEKKTTSCELWVDKYRPKRYVDLLSDETINRSLLYWLKLWDKIVFDRDPTVRKKKQQTFVSTKFKNKFKKKDEDVPDHDSKGFPTHRIALLSGPPGLGKTTLAHIAAKHAGYNVVELNASDDRGPETFREALLATTQMRAVIDQEKRPNCLVLDEIDGAPAASIDLLLKFIHGKLAPKGKTLKNKGNKENDGCRRPIICICNDLYAPSLRPLRSMALVINVPEITPDALAHRLAEITYKEGLKVDMRTLVQLAERSACDVRACLGILQYTGGGANMLKNITLGLKDTRMGLFDSWKEMLQVPYSQQGIMPVTERVKKVMKIAHQVEADRLAQGVFHNYPEICKDAIVPVSKCLQWFEFYDEVTRLVMEQQTWILMPYTNLALVAWHLYLANTQTPKITYPSAMFEVNQKLERNKSILMVTKKTCKIDVLTLVSDFLPYLPDLLSPRLRSVNIQLFSPKEKQDLQNLINLMLDFGLTFTQERKREGGYEYNLDPNLWDLGTFPNCKVRKPLPYAVKQIIIQELETARLQRAAIASGETTGNTDTISKSSTNKDKTNSDKTSSNKIGNENTSKDQQKIPNHMKQQLNPVQVQPTDEKKNRNFFFAFQMAGKEKHKKKMEKDKEEGIVDVAGIEKAERDKAAQKRADLFKSNVYLEFKEGYSNAVRRTVLMKNLM